VISLTWIKDIVGELINRHNTANPFELAILKKIHVIYHDLHPEIQGFYKYDKRNKYIVINSNLNETIQMFVCAHEIGHAELHPRVNTPFLREKTFLSIDRIEVEANTFAVELLLPDKAIYEHSNLGMTLNEIASMFCVPEEVTHLKSLRNVHGKEFNKGGY